ncbi:MAG: SOS response-associated peptidase, partial [Terriglobia bacterium]|nr:SOS response-associated peptidase [Terriglobia bacterium]
PGDAFFEWKKIDAKTKQPYVFALKDNAMLAFAGIWERWNAPDGKPLDTFAIITTEPNELAASVHNRMPVILGPQHYARWLTRADEEPLPIHLLRPYDSHAMRAWKVGREVGNVRNNGPDLLA